MSVDYAAPPTPLQLPAFVPYACRELGAHFDVRVDVTTQQEYVSKIDTPKKPPKSKATSRQTSAPETVKVEESATAQAFFNAAEGDEVTVGAVMDVLGHLVEISFQSEPEVPCLLVKIIGMCVPYQQLFNKLAVRWSGLDGVTLYEMSKYLAMSQLTELCLDDSPVPERNYAILLEQPSHLKHLSLARCDLVDEDCIAICDKLVYPRPASTTLQLLNLASNTIDDAGAHAIGEMLRSNRTLQYLNLSGNRISDAGAGDIFKSLVDFKITATEIHDKRLRMIEHLRLRKEVYERCLRMVIQEIEASRSKLMKKSGNRGVKKNPNEARFSLDAVVSRAEALAAEQLSGTAEPFARDETAPRARALYSLGNRALCYLNLCYNHLGYKSVTELVRVLVHQSSGTSKFGAGLTRVLVEGNPLPVLCADYEQLDELLENIYKAKELATKNKSRPDRSGKGKSQILKSK